MLGRTHFENVRNHLATYGIIPRIHGNVTTRFRFRDPETGWPISNLQKCDDLQKIFLSP